MRESPATRHDDILKCTAFRASIALQPVAANPFMRPQKTTNHPDQCQKSARLFALTAHFTSCKPPPSIIYFRLSPSVPPSTCGSNLGRVSNAGQSEFASKPCTLAHFENPSPQVTFGCRLQGHAFGGVVPFEINRHSCSLAFKNKSLHRPQSRHHNQLLKFCDRTEHSC